mgnify:CR=1 FL=1
MRSAMLCVPCAASLAACAALAASVLAFTACALRGARGFVVVLMVCRVVFWRAGA